MAQNILWLTPEAIDSLISGDADVFRELFLEFQPRLYHFLWLKLRSVELAEDLTQETFIRLWNARQHLKPNTNLEIYLFRIASNLATDSLRKSERRKTVHGVDFDKMTAADSSDQQLEFRQLARIIDAILPTLPDGPRTAFILNRYEELSYKEVAAIMGVSIKTIEKHIAKALEVIQKKLRKIEWVLE